MLHRVTCTPAYRSASAVGYRCHCPKSGIRRTEDGGHHGLAERGFHTLHCGNPGGLGHSQGALRPNLHKFAVRDGQRSQPGHMQGGIRSSCKAAMVQGITGRHAATPHRARDGRGAPSCLRVTIIAHRACSAVLWRGIWSEQAVCIPPSQMYRDPSRRIGHTGLQSLRAGPAASADPRLVAQSGVVATHGARSIVGRRPIRQRVTCTRLYGGRSRPLIQDTAPSGQRISRRSMRLSGDRPKCSWALWPDR